MATLLRATSPTSVVIGPFVSTGATAQTAIEVSSATIVDLYKITAKSDITTTTAGANAMAHVANGYYSLVLTSGNTDTVGPLMITADSTGSMSVWARYQVIPAAIYDALMTGTVTLDSTFANGAQASSLLAMGVSVASTLTRVTASNVAEASALAKIDIIDTVVDSIKVETASSLAKIDIIDTVVDGIKVETASSLAKIDIIDTVVDGIKVETASSLVWIASAHANIATVDTVVDAIKVETASSLVRIVAVPSATWDIAIAAHVTSGTTAEALNAAGGAGDPWVTALPGSYTGAQAGAILSAVNINMSSSLAKIDIIDTVVDAVKVDTASSQVWIASVHANIATMDGAVSSMQGDVTTTLGIIQTAAVDLASIAVDTASALVNIALLPTAATINAQVLDVLNVDTFAEPGQEAPAATNTLAKKIGYTYKFLRNKITTTSALTSIYDDTGAVVDQKATVSDDGTTFTRGEFGSGA